VTMVDANVVEDVVIGVDRVGTGLLLGLCGPIR